MLLSNDSCVAVNCFLRHNQEGKVLYSHTGDHTYGVFIGQSTAVDQSEPDN